MHGSKVSIAAAVGLAVVLLGGPLEAQPTTARSLWESFSVSEQTAFAMGAVSGLLASSQFLRAIAEDLESSGSDKSTAIVVRSVYDTLQAFVFAKGKGSDTFSALELVGRLREIMRSTLASTSVPAADLALAVFQALVVAHEDRD